MGYSSQLSGEMSFSRPLTAKETRVVDAVIDREVWDYYRLTIESTSEETEEGTLTRTFAYGIELIEEGWSGKAYEWENELRKIAHALPDDVTTSGYFERSGEEAPDLERLYIRNGDVVSVKPEIVWPQV
jgi:hypothetical protein